MRRLLLIAVLASASACGKSAESCAKEANAIGALLQGVNTKPSLFWIPDNLHLIVRADLPERPERSGPLVTLRNGGVEYQGQLLSVQDLGDRLAAAHAKIVEDLEVGRFPKRSAPNPALVYFLVDETTPWSQVVAAVDAAKAAGMTDPAFAFALPSTVTSPPRAPIDSKLDELMEVDSGNRASEFAKLLSTEIEGCASLVKLFGELAAIEGGGKDEHLARSIGPALIGCNCSVNMPNVRSLLFRLLVNMHPVRMIAFSSDGPATKVAAPAAATWREVATKLAPDLANATFVVE